MQMNKKREILSNQYVLNIGFTIVVFLILLSYLNRPFFISDEGDVYLLGRSVANGLMIYRDVPSQHMPVMYYIAAIFSKLGAVTVTHFRICFYIFLAILWGSIFAIYGPKIGHKNAGLGITMYLLLIGHIDMGYTILSEQLQAIGMIVLLYELLLFQTKYELSIKSMIMVSIAVFLSFGSAFVSVFSIGFVACTVLLLDIQNVYAKKVRVREWMHGAFRKYGTLSVIVACPFAILIIYYVLTGTLGDFWGMAYKLNREIYPRYLGGYGDSILKTIENGMLYILDVFKSWNNISSTMDAIYILLMILVLYCIIHIQRKRKNLILTMGIALMLGGSATRGVFNFHGLASCALICALSAIAIVNISDSIRNSNIKYSAAGIIIIIIAMQIRDAGRIISTSDSAENSADFSMTHAIKLIAEKNEIIGFSTLETNCIFESETLPSYGNAACPWMWEWIKTRAMDEYRNNPPRIFVYDPTYETWGYPIIDYAAELDKFINQNYTLVDEDNYPALYVRNDYYNEAAQIILDDYMMQAGHNPPKVSLTVSDDHSKLRIELNRDDYYDNPQFAVWSDENGQDDLRWYDATETDPQKWICEVNLDDYSSKGLYYIHIYAMHNDEQEFVVGKTIEI